MALDLLARLPDTRVRARGWPTAAGACLRRRRRDGVDVAPAGQCDRSMQRDGVAPRPPAGTGSAPGGSRRCWPAPRCATWGPPDELLRRPIPEEWAGVVRRGLGRAAAAQRDGEWAAALVDRLWPEATAAQRPDDRLLLEALYEALPAGAAGRAGRRRCCATTLAGATPPASSGCSSCARGRGRRSSPTAAARARSRSWCAAARRPGGSPACVTLGRHPAAARHRPRPLVARASDARPGRGRASCDAADRPTDPRLGTIDQLLDVLRFRHEMHEELDSDRYRRGGTPRTSSPPSWPRSPPATTGRGRRAGGCRRRPS